MAPRQAPASNLAARRGAAVWIDHDEAVIVETGPDDRQSVEVLVRGPGEAEATFEARAIDEVIDEQRVVVSGPPDTRLGFERAYVAVTHRPDRLADVEPGVDLDPRTAVPRRARRTS